MGRLRYTDHEGRPALRHFINVASFGIAGLVDKYVNRSKKSLGGTLSFALATLRAGVAYSNTQVRVRMEQPVSVNSQAVSGNITIATGPWLASGDWWTDAPWNRAEWDIELASGGLYRVYQTLIEPGQPHWFLEGMYD